MKQKQYFKNRMACELCGSPKSWLVMSVDYNDRRVRGFIKAYYKNFDTKYLLGARYEIKKCLRCGFLWQSDVPDGELLRKLYDEEIDGDDSLRKKLTAAPEHLEFLAAEVAAIRKLVDRERGEVRVLDFGMGWGQWCLMARAFGYRVYGTELSMSRREYVQGFGGISVVTVGSLADNWLDYVNAEQVFEHVVGVGALVREIVKKMRCGGVLRIGVPSGGAVERRFRKRDWRCEKGPDQPLEHINIFTPKALNSFARSCGLEPLGSPFLVVPNAGFRQVVRAAGAKFYRDMSGRSYYFRKQ